jgi:Fe2+ or Zn2+ uptake regulation protein
MVGFYNTIHENGQELRESKAKVRKQEEIVLQFFQYHRRGNFTPDEVHGVVLQKAPLTSIRRAITNLTDQGKLIKTDEMRAGVYGKLTHTWELAPADKGQKQLDLFGFGG